ncbi:hypothetical protein A2Z67_00160 [Candidatus Woesebacteria bacterium RBG_13_36_22]|uniref:DUF559 domain-containing protein n=1 Tax=Candidatus Woesebacteria bacterium RBG_13_36_22 TaxID=1802478 RepID=A0A1F7X465_9BACT|nr:MAG: hypothetical protein A2Z67_00160 [Candidatus Woesebacteria bacterium RBG_13_36_22]
MPFDKSPEGRERAREAGRKKKITPKLREAARKNLKKFAHSENYSEHARKAQRAAAERNRRLGFNPFANRDPIKHAEATREGIRKSEKHRNTSRQNRINYNKSEEGQRHLVELHNSEKRKESCSKVLKLYNKSEEHREVARKALQKMQLSKLTSSQKILNEALLNKGIRTIVEFWIPKYRRFIDIAIPKSKIAIEVDGSSHSNLEFCKLFGWTSLEEKQADDRLKDRQLQFLGWKVLRFTNEEVDKNIGNVIESIERKVQNF